jgi:uncharacterized protein YPO0396
MQTMRDKWTDERLDDLNAKVDRGFDQLREEMRDLREEMRAFRAEINARFDAMDRRIDAMNRNMLWFVGALAIAIVASNLAS